MPSKVFVSYSHSDELMYDRLVKHLKPLEHEGLIALWHDRRLTAGSEFDDAIASELESADIVLLLISSDFVASEYCWGKEMRRAVERHDTGSARAVPVILRPVDWRTCPFGKLLALPKDGKPVMSWANIDEAFLDVSLEIRKMVHGSAGPALDHTTPPGPRPVPIRLEEGLPGQGVGHLSLSFSTFESSSLNKVVDSLSFGTSYDVLIDGSKRATIALGEKLEFSIAAGDHTILLKRLWATSDTVNFSVRPNGHIAMKCFVALYDGSLPPVDRALSVWGLKKSVVIRIE